MMLIEDRLINRLGGIDFLDPRADAAHQVFHVGEAGFRHHAACDGREKADVADQDEELGFIPTFHFFREFVKRHVFGMGDRGDLCFHRFAQVDQAQVFVLRQLVLQFFWLMAYLDCSLSS